MTNWKRRSLFCLLLALVALANLVAARAERPNADVFSPFVLVEVGDEGEAEESGEFVLLGANDLRVMAVEVTYSAHIAEECEFERVRQRKAHFWRGPPAMDVNSSRG